METVVVIIFRFAFTVGLNFRDNFKPPAIDLIAVGSPNSLQLISRFFSEDVGKSFAHGANIKPEPAGVHHQISKSCSLHDHVPGDDVGMFGKNDITHFGGTEGTEIFVF